jgi:hypothetical protein
VQRERHGPARGGAAERLPDDVPFEAAEPSKEPRGVYANAGGRRPAAVRLGYAIACRNLRSRCQPCCEIDLVSRAEPLGHAEWRALRQCMEIRLTACSFDMDRPKSVRNARREPHGSPTMRVLPLPRGRPICVPMR